MTTEARKKSTSTFESNLFKKLVSIKVLTGSLIHLKNKGGVIHLKNEWGIIPFQLGLKIIMLH